jgi:hypothetical protein
MHSSGRLLIAFGLMLTLAGCSSTTPTEPEPTPTPVPTPVPTPTPTPTPTATGCTLAGLPECGGPESPPGSGRYGCCREQNTDFLGQPVEDALIIVEAQRPDLVDSAGRIQVDERAFGEAVCEIIESISDLCCTVGGPPDEIGVKSENGFSEQFDLVFGSGHLRHNGYSATCSPARF